MQEKKIMPRSIAESFRDNMQRLFLYCVFTNPEHIRADIGKHFSIDEEKINLRCERTKTNDKGEEIKKYYFLHIFDGEYLLVFAKRVYKPKEVEIPKVVYLPKKWWQFKPSKKVVMEKKTLSNGVLNERWILKTIE